MADPLKLLCVLPHPDDETLGCGFTLAKYAAESVEVHLVTATNGERGWSGIPEVNPGEEGMGRLREAELRCAAQALGIRELSFLGYIDGEVDRADPMEITGRIISHIRRVRPQVVLTFDPTGVYGHPDHIALTQFTTAAVMGAANPAWRDEHNLEAFQVSKMYYQADSIPLVDFVRERLGGVTMEVDGVVREHTGWVNWAISAQIDASAYWDTGMRAIACHQSQVQEMLPLLRGEAGDFDRRVWSVQTFVRVFSLVNGGRKRETDLFDGLR